MRMLFFKFRFSRYTHSFRISCSALLRREGRITRERFFFRKSRSHFSSFSPVRSFSRMRITLPKRLSGLEGLGDLRLFQGSVGAAQDVPDGIAVPVQLGGALLDTLAEGDQTGVAAVPVLR